VRKLEVNPITRETFINHKNTPGYNTRSPAALIATPPDKDPKITSSFIKFSFTHVKFLIFN
jgi:hypothetical protein